MDGWIESITDHAKCPWGRNENGREGLNEGVVFLFYGVNKETKIMAFSPITSWQIDRETVETVSDFIFLGSKTTADVDCSHEIKRHLFLGRKVMTNLNSKLKSRYITLPTSSIQSKLWFFQ